MSAYLEDLDRDLQAGGFAGKLLVASVSGGLLEPDRLAAAPIHSINSGPALAPVAGRHYAAGAQRQRDRDRDRRRRHELRRERRSARPHPAHPRDLARRAVRRPPDRASRRWTCAPRAPGGGSIASVDAGGLLTVGPRSAGLPARARLLRPRRHGGHGHRRRRRRSGCLDGGRLAALGIDVDLEAAHSRDRPRTWGSRSASSATRPPPRLIRLVTEQMIHAVEAVTVDQGVDPRGAVLVSGGARGGLQRGRHRPSDGLRAARDPARRARRSAPRAGCCRRSSGRAHGGARGHDGAVRPRRPSTPCSPTSSGCGRAWVERSGLDLGRRGGRPDGRRPLPRPGVGSRADAAGRPLRERGRCRGAPRRRSTGSTRRCSR